MFQESVFIYLETISALHQRELKFLQEEAP